MDQEDHDKLDALIEAGYLQSDLQPLRCDGCESVQLREITKAIDGGYISESETVCSSCKKVLGYWAYGSWQA